MTKFVPNGERILVKRVRENKDQKVGGILLPDSAKKEQEVYEVIVGNENDPQREPGWEPLYKMGDKIILHPYNKISIQLDGEEHFIVETKDVLGWIEDFT
jgi:chaperonin GroES